MDRPDFMGLYESYLGVYEEVESIEEEVEKIDEGIRQDIGRGMRRSFRTIRNAVGDLADRAEWHTLTRAEQREQRNKMHEFRNTPEGHEAIMRRNKDRQGKYNEEVDLYDLVLEYLLDEGLCESAENAEIMMAHMSESWIDSIVEASEIMSITSPEGKRRKVNRTYPSARANQNRQNSRKLGALQKRQALNPKAMGTRSARRQADQERDYIERKSIERMNAKPGIDVDDHGNTEHGPDAEYHYNLRRTDRAARRRRELGK